MLIDFISKMVNTFSKKNKCLKFNKSKVLLKSKYTKSKQDMYRKFNFWL